VRVLREDSRYTDQAEKINAMNNDNPQSKSVPPEAVTRHIVMDRHINPHGHVFGGVLLAWMDEGAGLYAMERTGCVHLVTVSMDDVVFKAPVKRGDQVIIQCRLDTIGRSSISVEVCAHVFDPVQITRTEVITSKITYVSLRGDKPYRYFLSAEYEDWLRRKASQSDGA